LIRSIFREGTIAGLLGAVSVAIWFFVIDLVRFTPFVTPYTLGRALFGRLGMPAASTPEPAVVFGYTVFHVVAFIAVGIAVAAIVHRAEAEPALLAGALILFIMFEVGFHAFLATFGSIPVLGAIAWHNVAIGNLVAALTMGTYVWRTHPELKGELTYALEGHE
jgi:hypothetical protein